MFVDKINVNPKKDLPKNDPLEIILGLTLIY